MKQKMKRYTYLFVLVLAGLVVMLVDHDTDPVLERFEGNMIAHFIDVDQGDATLLEGPDFTVLIDAGRHDRDDVVPYLKSVGVEYIDLIIGTHPHADHIGQLDRVLAEFPVQEVWMSGDTHSTRTFERAVEAILQSDATYYEPRAGETFEIGSLRIEVVHPETLTGDLDEGSISIRAVYGEVALLFTGDAGQASEQEMIARGHQLQADIFQLGHHGSSTSNGEEFLQAVKPKVAIYSAGQDNSYGHPHREVVQLISSLNIPLYGTAEHGTIWVITDGAEFSVDYERR
ncbi:beta-lactamase superfamily II metal-dependent hydrolase [Caldalkalibacillus uzonensis]|uniref:Beta-lactamase superfamily II metal-dependent hydrolase n=1 Tax=Caldalkalibacillus uzonensis TaxID=353224 RepID=A0ABU0CSJ3_9BACI|nr:ComEC/Rec2 family competence protein [Caldalkalibacillus uzonensis]MDQ0338866.1 beta-lactamase superfamily II metal-dependent hydrolase [Caldalkalibacillus uzonensis]